MVDSRQYWMEQPTKALRPKPARPVVKRPSLDEVVEALAVEEFRNPEVTGRGVDRGRGLEIKHKSVGSPGLSRYDAQLTPVKKPNDFKIPYVSDFLDSSYNPSNFITEKTQQAVRALKDLSFPSGPQVPVAGIRGVTPTMGAGDLPNLAKDMFILATTEDFGDTKEGRKDTPVPVNRALAGVFGAGKYFNRGKNIQRPNISMKKEPKQEGYWVPEKGPVKPRYEGETEPFKTLDEKIAEVDKNLPITEEIPLVKQVLRDIKSNPYERPPVQMKDDVVKNDKAFQDYKSKTMTSEVDEMMAAKAEGRAIDTSPSVAKREAMDRVSQIEINPSTAVPLKHDAVVSPQLISIEGSDGLREIAVVQLDNGLRMPFYRRSGTGTDAQRGIHEKGDWKPFFGLKEDVASPGAGWNPGIRRGWFLKHPSHETLHTGSEFERELFDIGKDLKRLFDRGKLKVDSNYIYNSNSYPPAIEEINVLLGSNGRLLGKQGLSGVYGEEVVNPSAFNKGNVTDFKPPVRDPLGNPTAAYAWKQLPRK